jgi:hypothetical protein
MIAGGGSTLAGVALQGAIGTVRERRAGIERRSARWDEKKLEICANFLLRLSDCAYDISTWTDLRIAWGLSEEDATVVARLDSYRQGVAELRRIMQQLQLVMSDEVFQHAAGGRQALSSLRELGMNGVGVHEAEWTTTHDRLDVARDLFRGAVRDQLGIGEID